MRSSQRTQRKHSTLPDTQSLKYRQSIEYQILECRWVSKPRTDPTHRGWILVNKVTIIKHMRMSKILNNSAIIPPQLPKTNNTFIQAHLKIKIVPITIRLIKPASRRRSMDAQYLWINCFNLRLEYHVALIASISLRTAALKFPQTKATT